MARFVAATWGRSASAATVASATITMATPIWLRNFLPLTLTAAVPGENASACAPVLPTTFTLPLSVRDLLPGLPCQTFHFCQYSASLLRIELLFQALQSQSDDIAMVELGAHGRFFAQ